MKTAFYGILTGALLALTLLGTGCASNPNDPDIFKLIGAIGQDTMRTHNATPSTYQSNSVNCTTVQNGTDWYGNPRYRTVCQ